MFYKMPGRFIKFNSYESVYGEPPKYNRMDKNVFFHLVIIGL